MQDLLFEIVNSDEQDLMNFIHAIKNSNIVENLQEQIIEVLYTVINQTRQAKKNGWL
ncbi:MAG: hypothetical protein RIS73_260 [Bacteroidota bacterium]|jgi:hypothetical protein